MYRKELRAVSMKIKKHKTCSFYLTKAAHVYRPATIGHHLHSTLFTSTADALLSLLHTASALYTESVYLERSRSDSVQWGAKEKAPGFPRYRRCTDNQPQNNNAPGLGKQAEFALASRKGCHAISL